MEGSSSCLGSQSHLRSISLPSRLHPNATKIESELNELKTSFSAASISPDTIQNGLVGLAELYNNVEELIHSPHTQQALLRHQNGALVEDAAEGLIGLLDSCSSLKDLFSLMKEKVQDLQSALRRKGGDSSTDTSITAYFCSRKKMEKIAAKCLRGLKLLESKARSSLLLDVDQHLSVVIRVLRDLAVITISVFRSVFLLLSCSKIKSSDRWSLISKLMTKSSTACKRDEVTVNEVESVDFALRAATNICLETTQERLQSLDARVQGFEAGLECVFRRLIQSRASLLNILAK